MGRLDGKTAVVTGGSRGLGKAIAEALAGEGAAIWAVARDRKRLTELEGEIAGIKTLATDVATAEGAEAVFAAVTPDILVLSAGATPLMGSVREMSWEDFSRNWQTDVQSVFHFGAAALRAPMPAGGQVMTVSSGAAINGSFASGGYAGAKRMQWFLSDYFQREAKAAGLDIRFTTLLPRRIFGETALGHAAATGYGDQLGIGKEEFLKRFPPYAPEDLGRDAVAILLDEAYRDGTAYATNGEGVTRSDG